MLRKFGKEISFLFFLKIQCRSEILGNWRLRNITSGANMDGFLNSLGIDSSSKASLCAFAGHKYLKMRAKQCKRSGTLW